MLSLAYLITESNIRAYAQPITTFAMLSLASRGVTTKLNPTASDLAVAFPPTALYVWLLVLHFDCSNQKNPESIEEDRLNKPWRAIPSGRLTAEGAQTWFEASCFLLLLVSGTWLGGFPEAVLFMLQTWLHDQAGGSRSWFWKNFLNSLFYPTGQLGASRVAARAAGMASITPKGYLWCLLLSITTFATIQLQDLRDQAGDKAGGRRTFPLVVGDKIARWTTAFSIAFWSIACPLFWADGHLSAGLVLPMLVGLAISVRTVALRSVKADSATFELYSLLWLPSLYLVPLLTGFGARLGL